MRATALTLAAAALAAGTFLLTGCEPANTAGGASSSGGLGVDCDPSGFGPLAGCDSTNAPVPEEDSSEPTEDSPPPDEDESAHKPSDAEPAYCPDDSHDLDLGAGRFDDKTENGCESSPDAEHWDQVWDQKITEDRYSVTVTWIVVSIEFTGFRECVIGLREEQAESDDHFSRRVTTKEDCKAQQVYTVYRPVVSSGK